MALYRAQTMALDWTEYPESDGEPKKGIPTLRTMPKGGDPAQPDHHDEWAIRGPLPAGATGTHQRGGRGQPAHLLHRRQRARPRLPGYLHCPRCATGTASHLDDLDRGEVPRHRIRDQFPQYA